MALIVQKYGGTSVGSPERIQAVARRVAKYRAQGHQVVVVVSAMGDTTDELLAMADRIGLRGASVASPHKMDAARMAECDAVATAVGAATTVVSTTVDVASGAVCTIACSSDDKKKARLNCIHHLLQQMPYEETEHPPVVLPPRVRHEDYERRPVPLDIMVPEVY